MNHPVVITGCSPSVWRLALDSEVTAPSCANSFFRYAKTFVKYALQTFACQCTHT